MEPGDPFSRHALVGLRWRKGNPCQDRRAIRVSQRLAAGMSVAEVARAEHSDEPAIEGLLARRGFAALVESWRAMAEQPEAEQTARLVKLARIAIENALDDWDMGAAFFVLRENTQGRDPAHTVARRIVASAKRSAAAPPTPTVEPPPAPPAAPPAPPRPYDPLDALVSRQTAALRRAVLAEQAARTVAAAEVAADGAAATMAAARKALALKADAARLPVSPIARLTRQLAAGSAMPIMADLNAGRSAVPMPSQPRRPQAP